MNIVHQYDEVGTKHNMDAMFTLIYFILQHLAGLAEIQISSQPHC